MPLGTVRIEEGRHEDLWKIRSGQNEFSFDQTMLKKSGWGSLSEDDIKKGLDVEFDLSDGRQLSNVRLYSVAPPEVRSLVNQNGCVHPGLILDKFAYRASEQAFSRKTLSEVIKKNPSIAETFSYALKRRKLEIASCEVWSCKTCSYVTLHLSRASALENAGICLHPLYGFVYLPGSGLKGMARAYAETIWLPTQATCEESAKTAWKKIEDVFGWAPNPERNIRINDERHPAQRRNDEKFAEVRAHAGNVVFHDAWPEEWPELVIDIINNHHAKYYEGKDNQNPPGDWEDPVPVCFLAIGPGNTFNFAISKRRDDVSKELLSLAKEWLTGALCHMGAGAKTNAGYGYFEPIEGVKPNLPKTDNRVEEEFELEFVTPAFLAGANQKAADCELRPATLRGQLRWWWRVMHAGCMDTAHLRELEGVIWGDTKCGGAVQIIIEPKGDRPKAIPYNKRSKANMTEEEKAVALGIRVNDRKKITQGLWYHSYGMDDSGKRRHYIEAGSKYCVIVKAKDTIISRKDKSRTIYSKDVLKQAESALWLLSRFGGVGAKSRRGFGCFRKINNPNMNIEQCKNIAEEFRKEYEFVTATQGDLSVAALENIQLVETQTNWGANDTWSAFDQVGFAAQAFAKKLAHMKRKMGLGLPRRIGPPPIGTFNAVYGEKRHASPIHYHISPDQHGHLKISVTMFPVSSLDGQKNNKVLLQELLAFLQGDLPNRGSSVLTGVSMNSNDSYRVDTAGLPGKGDVVSAEIVSDPKGKGRPWASMKESPYLSGNFINPDDVPKNIEAGSEVRLIVDMIGLDGKSIRFKWLVGE